MERQSDAYKSHSDYCCLRPPSPALLPIRPAVLTFNATQRIHARRFGAPQTVGDKANRAALDFISAAATVSIDRGNK
jgi:hypothetical protein